MESLTTSFQNMHLGNPQPGSIINKSRYKTAVPIAFEADLLDRVGTLRETIGEGHSFTAVLSHAVLLLREIPRYSDPAFGRMRKQPLPFEVPEELFEFLEVLSQDDSRIIWDSNIPWSEESVQSGTFKERLSSGEDVRLTRFSFMLEEGEVREAFFFLTSPENFSAIQRECDRLLSEILAYHQDTEQLQNLIPTLFWWMTQGSFFEEGNAEVFELIVAACMHESALQPWNPEFDSYEAALMMSMEEFFNFCESLKNP